MQKSHWLSLPLLNTRRMPRLSLAQREERPLFVPHAFNCNVYTIQRIQERYNTTGSTNGHDSYILRQHMNNQLTRATQIA